jgi:hypothetical protein
MDVNDLEMKAGRFMNADGLMRKTDVPRRLRATET